MISEASMRLAGDTARGDCPSLAGETWLEPRDASVRFYEPMENRDDPPPEEDDGLGDRVWREAVEAHQVVRGYQLESPWAFPWHSDSAA